MTEERRRHAAAASMNTLAAYQLLEDLNLPAAQREVVEQAAGDLIDEVRRWRDAWWAVDRVREERGGSPGVRVPAGDTRADLIAELEALVSHLRGEGQRTDRARLALLAFAHAVRDTVVMYRAGKFPEGYTVAKLVNTLEAAVGRTLTRYQRITSGEL